MERKNIKEILEKVGKQEITAEEEAQAKLWLFQLHADKKTELTEEQLQGASKSILDRLEMRQRKTKIYRLRKVWIAAASIFLVFSISVLLYVYREQEASIYQAHEIMPAENGATLTLADGSTILIGDLATGNIVNQPGVTISKDADGVIVYEITENSTNESSFNTLSTRRGQQANVRLPDGSIVSLNASSSLKYPTSFAHAPNRMVSLTGEGYFQVAKNVEHPFVVKMSNQVVKVLGTKFNINSYNPQEQITTLEEGSVMVSAAKESIVIQPGEEVLNNGSSLRVQRADLEQALAWKEGNFIFMGATIERIMRQLADWYDVDIVYEGPISTTPIYANISRYRHLRDILHMLESAGDVHFETKGRRVYVRK